MKAFRALEELRTRVLNLRRKGHVRSFPLDIREEAVRFVAQYGVPCVAEKTSLAAPILCEWQKRQAKSAVLESGTVPPASIEVTRVSMISQKEAHALAILERGNRRLLIQSNELALLVVREILGESP